MQEKVSYTLARYGNSTKFGATFSINNLNRYVLHPERCCIGSAPSLYTMKATYGDAYPIQWLMGIIIAFSEYSGCRRKVSPFQAERLAYNIFSEYNFLKPTEIMLFFHHLECGYYGQVDWGAFDPVKIFSKIPLFLEYRQNIYAKEEARIQEQRMEEERKKAVPPPPEIKARLDALFNTFPTKRSAAPQSSGAPVKFSEASPQSQEAKLPHPQEAELPPEKT